MTGSASIDRAHVEAGARAAALAVGRLLRRPGMAADVDEATPDVVLARAGARAVAVWFTVVGAHGGRFAALLTEEDALGLTRHLLKPTPKTSPGSVNKHEKAALSELGNIVASAFLNGVAGAAGRYVPSVPTLVVDSGPIAVEQALGGFGTAWCGRIDVDGRALWVLWVV
jgi:hypothetical protein